MANVTPITPQPNMSMWQPHRPERFRLVSEFEPKGDQPKAIEELCDGLDSIDRDQVLLGVTGSGKTFTMAKIIEQTQRPALIMAPNKTLAAQLYAEFKSFFPDNAVEYYDYYQPEAYVARTDTFIEKDSSVNEQIDRMRHAATRAILERDDCIIVASVSCIYGIGSVETYTAMTVDLAKGQEMDPRRLMSQLVELQYQRNDLAFQRGCFRVRGDTIELKTMREIDGVRVYANSHYVTPRPTVQSALKGIKKELQETLAQFESEGKLVEAQRIAQRTEFDLEMMAASGFCNGIENYSRYLTGRAQGEPPPTMFEYLPENALLFMDESHVSVPQIGAMSKGDFNRKSTLANAVLITAR